MGAYSRILLPWDSQPQEVPEVSPLFPAYFVYVPTVRQFDLAGRAALTEYSVASVGASADGIAANITNINGSIAAAATRTGASRPVTSVIRYRNNSANVTGIFLAAKSHYTLTHGWQFESKTDANTLEFIGGNATLFSTLSAPGAGAADGKFHTIVCEWFGSKVTVAMDGRPLGSVTVDAIGASNSGIGVLNYANNGTTGTNQTDRAVSLAAVLDGAFDLVGLSANPWQLFSPRTIWVPVSAATGGAYTLTADAGAYAIGGQDSALVKSRIVVADAGAYALAGQDATLTYAPATGAYTLTAEPGAYVLAGQDAALVRGRVVSADAGAYALAGQDATLTYALANAYTLTCEAGAYSLTGRDATIAFSGAQTADTHDGFWSREWYRLKKREEKKPTIAEVVEIVKESPQVLEVVRVEVERKYPQVDYAQVLANVQLQRFIARQLIEAAQDEDDLEVLLLA